MGTLKEAVTTESVIAISIPDPEKKGQIIFLKNLNGEEVEKLIEVIKAKILAISFIIGGNGKERKERKAKKQAYMASKTVLVKYFDKRF